MRLYETTFLIAPTLPEEEAEQLIEKMAGIVTEKKGKMINVDNWGKRRLAYPIKKFEDAVYVFFLYKGDVDIPTELERNFKQTESVIRYLTIKMEERENIRRLKKGASRAVETPREEPGAKEKTKEVTVVEEKPVEKSPEKKPKIETAAEEKQEEDKKEEKKQKEKKKEEEKQEEKKEEVKTPAKKKEDPKDKDPVPKKKGKDKETKENEVVPENEKAAVKEEKEK